VILGLNHLKRLNLHPKFRVDYYERLYRISSHITTVEAAYTRTNNGIYDAMPAFWKKLTIEYRQKVLSIITTVISNDLNPWTNKSFILKLSQFVDLRDVPKLRIYHQTKHDPSVIIGACTIIENKASDKEDTPPPSQIQNDTSSALIVRDPLAATIAPPTLTTTAIVPHNSTTIAHPEQKLLFTHSN